MPHELTIAPSGHLLLVESSSGDSSELSRSLIDAFSESPARGLLHLATHELQSRLPAALDFVRSFAGAYLNRVCQNQGHESARDLPPTPPPAESEVASWVLQAPPMTGLEYLNEAALAGWWADLDEVVRAEIHDHAGGAQAWLSEKNPLWRFVGRVTLHLAENKRDQHYPFAFLATYVSRLSQGRVLHERLAESLKQYAGAKNRQALLSLLSPLQKAAERSELIKEMVDSGDVYQPLAWTPREAHRFLKDIPVFEESGLIVRVPDWWSPRHVPRPVVSVQIDGKRGSRLSLGALLDFSVGAALDGEPLTESELLEVLSSEGGLVRLKGRWVEVDREKLVEALEHWRSIEGQVNRSGLTFFEGMRLLAGASLERDVSSELPESSREWVGLSPGPELKALLDRLRTPEARQVPSPPALRAELRPYQLVGLGWLHFLTQLGLGACLADDMGLGKTVQVIALLLAVKEKGQPNPPHPPAPSPTKGRGEDRQQAQTPCPPPPSPLVGEGGRGGEGDSGGGEVAPSLLVVPASLIANWKSEIERFAPSLTYSIAHPSESPGKELAPEDVEGRDLVITTYGMLSRQPWLLERTWRLAILDEAQAIKNSGTKQSKAARAIKSSARIALTGTPVENRLSDLWSLFDFLNPGLLGGSKAFAGFVKKLQAAPRPSYQPLRSLIGPYILRRLKTDKRVIADLPEKTEVKAFCGLSRQQAALYEQAVRELEDKISTVEGIHRRGLVLAQLMRLKQVCNHPAQLLGLGEFDPKQSGKFQRLGELCEEMAQRQEKVLVFTQFREIAEPLAGFLAGVFGRPGLVLHGGTAVAKRRELVASFQREDGPPFFVLSVKAGGVGLNLTAASQVIHFDRWWNPAVEDQATDRAFRIGQKRNVLVHKFVCRGTVEEKIDALIADKTGLVRDIVEGGEQLLTEMDNEELLKFIRLDVNKAMES